MRIRIRWRRRHENTRTTRPSVYGTTDWRIRGRCTSSSGAPPQHDGWAVTIWKSGWRDFGGGGVGGGGAEDGGQLSRSSSAAAAGRRPRTPSVGQRGTEICQFLKRAIYFYRLPAILYAIIIIILLLCMHTIITRELKFITCTEWLFCRWTTHYFKNSNHIISLKNIYLLFNKLLYFLSLSSWV